MSIIKEFLRHPRQTGAVAASSTHLARAMTAGLGLERARLVVELGPGTGAFTAEILARLAPGARLLAVELNAALAGPLGRRYHGRPIDVVNASAAELAEIAPGPVDVVVSGLPWTVMSDREQRSTLDAVTRVLTGDGRFATFAYLHAAWTPPASRFTARLTDRFAVTGRTPVIWRNLPPALVHRAALPRPVGPGRGRSALAVPHKIR